MVSNTVQPVSSHTDEMPNPSQEKERHSRYLNEFRTTQCALFLEQQCQFHRPYTCFYWHFPNQRRRRPFKRADGTFNYNPDVYCDKYDENSGTCSDGEDCPYAHRNAGDTERRYHPRYFKTGCCIYETAENGSCVKNGLHCAFAHGPDDVRTPVFDIREVQDASMKYTVNLPASLEKERVLSEDPQWNDMFHVLKCYKTELCKKPPRMCRQGYSCPFYHNGKDKRRPPDKYCYKSTPCPAVRPADEWLDSGMCENGDNCLYCHTRTEQQFHPEIYNSSKCNDVMNSGYCPRGPFCAFAHVDAEMHVGREFQAMLQLRNQHLIQQQQQHHHHHQAQQQQQPHQPAALWGMMKPTPPHSQEQAWLLRQHRSGYPMKGRHQSGGSSASVASSGATAFPGPPPPPTQPPSLFAGSPGAVAFGSARSLSGIPQNLPIQRIKTSGTPLTKQEGLSPVDSAVRPMMANPYAQWGPPMTPGAMAQPSHQTKPSEKQMVMAGPGKPRTPRGQPPRTTMVEASAPTYQQPRLQRPSEVLNEEQHRMVMELLNSCMPSSGGASNPTGRQMEAEFASASSSSTPLTDQALFSLWCRYLLQRPQKQTGLGLRPHHPMPTAQLLEEGNPEDQLLGLADHSNRTSGVFDDSLLLMGEFEAASVAEEYVRHNQASPEGTAVSTAPVNIPAKQDQQRVIMRPHANAQARPISYGGQRSGTRRGIDVPARHSQAAPGISCSWEQPPVGSPFSGASGSTAGAAESPSFMRHHGPDPVGSVASVAAIHPLHKTSSLSGSFSNLPQSPVLASSFLSNQSCDLERTVLRKELEIARSNLDTKQHECEEVRRERDLALTKLNQSVAVIKRLLQQWQDQMLTADRNSTASGQSLSPLSDCAAPEPVHDASDSGRPRPVEITDEMVMELLQSFAQQCSTDKDECSSAWQPDDFSPRQGNPTGSPWDCEVDGAGRGVAGGPFEPLELDPHYMLGAAGSEQAEGVASGPGFSNEPPTPLADPLAHLLRRSPFNERSMFSETGQLLDPDDAGHEELSEVTRKNAPSHRTHNESGIDVSISEDM